MSHEEEFQLLSAMFSLSNGENCAKISARVIQVKQKIHEEKFCQIDFSLGETYPDNPPGITIDFKGISPVENAAIVAKLKREAEENFLGTFFSSKKTSFFPNPAFRKSQFAAPIEFLEFYHVLKWRQNSNFFLYPPLENLNYGAKIQIFKISFF